MNILEIEEQNHSSKVTDQTKKLSLGEVKTDFKIINDYFLDDMPDYIFENMDYKWLDPGAGTGNFSICVFKKLMISLQTKIIDSEKRKNHIIEHMLYMVEFDSNNIKILKNIFGEKAHIYCQDFLDFNDMKFDVIIGNPPYNNNGIKKVPTNTYNNKLNDGNTIWTSFVRQAIHILKDNGYLTMIVPAIWLKPDKAKIYHLLTSYQILKLRCFNNTTTNKMFHGHAQTPTSIFHLVKKNTNNIIKIYDNNQFCDYFLKKEIPIPLMGISIINKLQKYVNDVGSLKVHKSNLPSKHIEIFEKKKHDSNYKNITTCILNKKIPEMVFNYSFVPCPFYKKPKLVLAHGMYGFPFLDHQGIYGISNRDKYVIMDKSIDDLKRLRSFLSTNLALYLFETTKYRMKYLEKYIFELIPDITKIKGFPIYIDDQTIAEFFQFSKDEIHNIENLHKNKYSII